MIRWTGQHNDRLRVISYGGKLNTSYYLPGDLANEVLYIVSYALRSGKTVAIDVQEETIKAALPKAITNHNLQSFILPQGRNEHIPSPIISQWKALLRQREAQVEALDSTHQHKVEKHLRQVYQPLYRGHSWSDLSTLLSTGGHVIQLLPMALHGSEAEYRELKRSISRMSQLWRPSYQALLHLNLFAGGLPHSESKIHRFLQQWYQQLVQLILALDESEMVAEADRHTRLIHDDKVQVILDQISALYDSINEAGLLAFELKNTAHYLHAVRGYAVDVCSRLRLGLDILSSEDGFMLWLHNYHRLPTMHRILIDHLRLYDVEEWVQRLETWYIGQLVRQNKPTTDAPTTHDWQAYVDHRADLEQGILPSDISAAIARGVQLLQKLIDQDGTYARQLLHRDAEHIDITVDQLIDDHIEVVDSIWPIRFDASEADIVVSDYRQGEQATLMIGNYPDSICPPVIQETTPIDQLPVAQRLAAVRPLAYWLTAYSPLIQLLVLRGRLVVSTIPARQLAPLITQLGDRFIRTIDIDGDLLNRTIDHMLASGVQIEVWIEGPLVNNRQWEDAAHQYHLLRQLEHAGYNVLPLQALLSATNQDVDSTSKPVPTESKGSTLPL